MAIIDIKSVNIQKLKLADLIADAVAREDKQAQEWLRTEAMKEIEFTDKDGNIKNKFQPANQFRVEYLEKFCGYKKKRKAEKPTAAQKRMNMLDNLFAQAASQIK
jgi:hypothetical protein